MQTTLRLDEKLMREAKADAARRGLSLTRWMEEAARSRLRAEAEAPKRRGKVRLPTLKLALKPGVRLETNADIWAALDSAELEAGRIPRS